jgi:hypothetical protein
MECLASTSAVTPESPYPKCQKVIELVRGLSLTLRSLDAPFQPPQQARRKCLEPIKQTLYDDEGEE